jgi:RNA polymerase sigma-70 factor (ECF subfamily)
MSASEPAPASVGLTSPSLLDRMKGQDEEAWRRFFHLYGPLVHDWCRGAGLRTEDAADVCQEVLRSVARGITSFQRPNSPGGGAFRGWLRAVTRNAVHDHFRKRARQPQAVGGSDAQERLQDLPELAPDDSAEFPDNERVGIVRRALELVHTEFAEQTWKSFLAVAIEGQPAPDVAKELGMTVSAVRQANYRVRRRLRAELAELLD